MPDFQQFADECVSVKLERQKEAEDSPLCTGETVCLACQKLYALAEQAEHHARLLHQILVFAHRSDKTIDDIRALLLDAGARLTSPPPPPDKGGLTKSKSL